MSVPTIVDRWLRRCRRLPGVTAPTPQRRAELALQCSSPLWWVHGAGSEQRSGGFRSSRDRMRVANAESQSQLLACSAKIDNS